MYCTARLRGVWPRDNWSAALTMIRPAVAITIRLLRIPFMSPSLHWLQDPTHLTLPRSSFHSGDRRAGRARVTHRPAAAIDLRQEFPQQAVEFVGRLEVDGVATVCHDR